MYNHKQYIKKAQVGVNPSASIPGQIPGANNIPLNGMAMQQDPGKAQQFMGQQPEGGAVGGADGKEAVDLLRKIEHASGKEEVQQYIDQIAELAKSSQQFGEEFYNLQNQMMSNADPTQQTNNLGEKMSSAPLAQETAGKLADRIEGYMKNASNEDIKIIEAAKKEQDADDGKKKKTRGNPFKVLMGKIGKLLDHGLGKREITKYLTRQGSWSEETVAKAINVVKDYNKKKHKKADTSFNLSRYAQITDSEQTKPSNTVPFRNSDVDENLEADWTKRSTAELFARAAWLKSAKEFTGDSHSEGRKASDIQGVAGELRSIRAQLKKRGFTEEELP